MDKFSVRNDIERIIKELKINRVDCDEVSKLQWKEILFKVEEHFVRKTHHSQGLHWAWNRLKEPCVGLRFQNDDGYKYINDIIKEERVWFIVEDNNGKMWIYEGIPQIISKIISENYYVDEYYIVSKKYEWLLCEDHHRIFYGSGERIVNQIDRFKTQRPELIYI